MHFRHYFLLFISVLLIEVWASSNSKPKTPNLLERKLYPVKCEIETHGSMPPRDLLLNHCYILDDRCNIKVVDSLINEDLSESESISFLSLDFFYYHKDIKKTIHLAGKIKGIINELYEIRASKSSPLAIYHLIAVLQIDCMIHRVLGKPFGLNDLIQLLAVRGELLRLGENRPHLFTARNLLSQPLSMRTWRILRKYLNDKSLAIELVLSAYPHYEASPMTLINAINHVNWVIYFGPISDFRAVIFANNASTFLLTEQAASVENCFPHDRYVAIDFQHWFYNLLGMRHWAGDNILANLLKEAIMVKNFKNIDLIENSFPMKILFNAYSIINEKELIEIVKQVPSSKLALYGLYKQYSAKAGTQKMDFLAFVQRIWSSDSQEFLTVLSQGIIGIAGSNVQINLRNPLYTIAEKLLTIDPEFIASGDEMIMKDAKSLIKRVNEECIQVGMIVPEIKNLDTLGQFIAFNRELGSVGSPIPFRLVSEHSNVSESFLCLAENYFINAKGLTEGLSYTLEMFPDSIRSIIGQNSSRDNDLQIYKLYLKSYVCALRSHSIAYSWYFKLVEQHALYLTPKHNSFFDGLNAKLSTASLDGPLTPGSKVSIILSSSRSIFNLMEDRNFQIRLSCLIREQFRGDPRLSTLTIAYIFMFFNVRGIDVYKMMRLSIEKGGNLICPKVGEDSLYLPVMHPSELLKGPNCCEIISFMTFSYCMFFYSLVPSQLKNEEGDGFKYGPIFRTIIDQFFFQLNHHQKMTVEFEIPMSSALIHLITLCVEHDQLEYLHFVLGGNFGNRYLVSILSFLPTRILDILARTEKPAELSLLASLSYGRIFIKKYEWNLSRWESLSNHYLSGGGDLEIETLIAFANRALIQSSKADLKEDPKLLEFFDSIYFDQDSPYSIYFVHLFTFSNNHQKQVVLRLLCSEFQRLVRFFPKIEILPNDETADSPHNDEVKRTFFSIKEEELVTVLPLEEDFSREKSIFSMFYQSLMMGQKNKEKALEYLSRLNINELRGLERFLGKGLAENQSGQYQDAIKLILEKVSKMTQDKKEERMRLEKRNIFVREGEELLQCKSCKEADGKWSDSSRKAKKGPSKIVELKRSNSKTVVAVQEKKNTTNKRIKPPINEKAIPNFVDDSSKTQNKKERRLPGSLAELRLKRYFDCQGDGICFLKSSVNLKEEIDLIRKYSEKLGFPFPLTLESVRALGLADSKRMKIWNFEKIFPEIPSRKNVKVDRLLDVLRGGNCLKDVDLFKLRSRLKYSTDRNVDNIQISLILRKALSPPVQICRGVLLVDQALALS